MPAGAGHCTVVMFFAAMAVAIKLSAAPILVIASLYCLLRVRHAPRSLVRIAILLAVVLGPTIYAGFVLNGCPAFPLTLGCLDMPWRIPPAVAHSFQAGVTRFGRWYATPLEANGALGWIVPYIFHPGNRLNPPLVVLAGLSIAMNVASFVKGYFARGAGWIFCLAAADFAFVMVTAPDTRFCIGAIALLLGQALSPWLLARQSMAPSRPNAVLGFALSSSIAVVVFQLAIVDPINARRWGQELTVDLHEELTDRWSIPVPLPFIAGVTRLKSGQPYGLASMSSMDVPYYKPVVGNQCWGAPLPCVPENPLPLQLRDPHRGIAGGFIRVTSE